MASDDSTGARRAPEHERPESAAVSPDDAGAANRASDSALTEDLALSLLKRPDLTAEALEQLAKNGNVLKNRKVKLALVEHPKTPRHVSLPLVRQLYTFDLMQIALTPVVPADVKRAADDVLCSKLETISQGERLTLAHRGSRRIAEALLSDAETRVMHAALQNSRLTESAIVRALARPGSSAALWRRCVITHNGRRGGKCGSLCSAMRRLRWRVRRPLLALSRLVWCGRFCTARGCRGV